MNVDTVDRSTTTGGLADWNVFIVKYVDVLSITRNHQLIRMPRNRRMTMKIACGVFVLLISLLSIAHGGELPVRDLSAQIHQGVTVPNLADLRQAYHHPMVPGVELRATSETNMPVPGGLGAGIIYQAGQLHALIGSSLNVTMFVQPNGLNPSTDGLDWLFLTATNRTADTLEIVSIYNQSGPGSLGVFDWSCSTAWPCTGNVTTPAWMYTEPMSALSCYITQTTDHTRLTENAMQYHNMTSGDGAGNWLNTAYLRNYCTNTWDIIYSHAYAGTLTDCSQANSCGWWGPILETFPSSSGHPIPLINRVGFQNLSLFHDHIADRLTDNVTTTTPGLTTFTYPIFPWVLYYLDPIRDYVAGNYVAP